jgi:hypothetical protein
VLVEGVAGAVERVRVAQAAAADPTSGRDEDVLEERQPQDPAEPGCGCPEVPARFPGGLGEVLVVEAAAALEHADVVALLGEPQGADRAAEAGADHQVVEVVARAGHHDAGSL